MDISTTHKVAALHRAIEEIASGIQYDGMTVRQLLVLLSVGSKTGPVSQNTVVEEQDLNKSTLSKMVAVLSGTSGDIRRDGLGLLSVDLDPSDLRSRLLSLSKEGDKLLSRAAKRAFPA
jgi:DNA-binding MarR family transcriptional regulator